MTRAWDTRWAMFVKTMLCIPSSRFQRQDCIAGQFWSPLYFGHFYPFALFWNCVPGDLFRREPIHGKQRTEHIFKISVPLSLPWTWNIRQWLWECRMLAAEYADSVLLKSHVRHLGFFVSHLLMSIRSICKMCKSKACSLDDWPARPWGFSHSSCVKYWMGNREIRVNLHRGSGKLEGGWSQISWNLRGWTPSNCCGRALETSLKFFPCLGNDANWCKPPCRDEASNASLKVELSVARGVLALDEPTSGEPPSSCIAMTCGW